jgi:hypothetical protein
MTMAILSKWHTRLLDFVLACTHADIERDLYMKILQGFTIPGNVLSEQDRSEHDECVFYHGTTIFTVYIDDTILLGPNKGS